MNSKVVSEQHTYVAIIHYDAGGLDSAVDQCPASYCVIATSICHKSLTLGNVYKSSFTYSYVCCSEMTLLLIGYLHSYTVCRMECLHAHTVTGCGFRLHPQPDTDSHYAVVLCTRVFHHATVTGI